MPHTITARHIKRHGPNVTRPKAPMTRQLINMAPVIGYWWVSSATGKLYSMAPPKKRKGRRVIETYLPVFGEGEIILHPTKGFRAQGATTPANELRKAQHRLRMAKQRAVNPVAEVRYSRTDAGIFAEAFGRKS